MNTTNHDPIQKAMAESWSSAPLDSATSGRFVFTAGATRVTLRDEPALAKLYRARFVHGAPGVHLEQEAAGQHKVTIHYWHRSLADRPAIGCEPLAAITLNGSIPWEIEFHGGVSHLHADLREVPLRSLDLSDSSGVRVDLPQPTGKVYLSVNGSASDVTILRPVQSALRVQIGGSASQVQIDDQYVGAVANGLHWQTPGYEAAPDRYDIRFAGGVSNVAIITE